MEVILQHLLWQDIWNYVCSQFYYIFQAIETEG